MKSQIKIIMFAFVALIAAMAGAFASPIDVTNVKIEQVNDDYVVIVSTLNANTQSGVYERLSFTIEELGVTFKDVPREFNSNETIVLTFNLADVVENYDMLKKGETYQLTVESTTSAVTETFMFGSLKTTEGLSLIVDSVALNGADISDLDVLQVLNGQNIALSLRFSAQENFDNARLMAFIEGYEHSPILATTEVFSVVEGNTYIKTLNFELPEDIRSMQNYKLRIVGANDLSGLTYKDYTIYVDTKRHRVDVLDLIMTPSSGVEPGSNVISQVRVKNYGQKSQESVKVTVTVPELGISESSYLSNLGTNAVATSDDMLLFVPSSAKAGQYEVEVELTFNEGHDAQTSTYTMNVLAPKTVEEEDLIVSFKNNLNLVAGQESVFEIVVANPNAQSKPISVAPLDSVWADVEITPSLAMVGAGSDAKFTVKVTPKSEVVGEKDVLLLVKEGTAVVSELSVKTYVEPTTQTNWTNIVLAVLLVLAIIILLALVIAIARKKDEKTSDENTEEYY